MSVKSLAQVCALATLLVATTSQAEVDFEGDFSAYQVPPVQLLKHDTNLTDIVVRNIFSDDLSKIYEIELLNDSYKTQNFRYNSSWYDATGQLVKRSQWKAVTLSPGADIYLEQNQPARATQLIIHLKP